MVIKAAPIPDFEKLVGLDHALDRMPGVDKVSLADYSKEEVTLRVDLAEPTSVEAFVSDLAQASGEELEVLAVGPGQLQLRIVRSE